MLTNNLKLEEFGVVKQIENVCKYISSQKFVESYYIWILFEQIINIFEHFV